MKVERYREIRQAVIDAGYGLDIEWSETVTAPSHCIAFFREYAFVVCNSGMNHKTARKIYSRVMEALPNKIPVIQVFKHKGKAGALEYVWMEKERLFDEYIEAEDKLAFLVKLPWIGEITKYHLAKNFGLDLCKPDRHLMRIAECYDLTPEIVCKALSMASGDRVSTVDVVLWRAAAIGLIDTRNVEAGAG